MPKKTNAELFEEAERAAVLDAIGETEQEIFDDALDRNPDDNDGDTSLEQMDGEDVLDEDDVDGDEEESDSAESNSDGEGEEGDETAPETRQQPDDRQQDRRGVPPARLREEADRRRAIEAEREQARAEARELRARLEALERGQRQQPQREDQTQPEGPDMFADPEGWANNLRTGIVREFNERRINDSMGEAEEAHGDTFREAFQGLQRSGNPALVSQILNSRNPGKSLMDWHGRQALMSEIGDDPAAYRQRVREELLSDPETRRAVISGARTDAMRGDRGAPRTQTRLPPSLNSATGGTSHRGGMTSRDTARTTKSTEQEIFDSVWDD